MAASLIGLWVLLVKNDGSHEKAEEGKPVPMVACTDDDHRFLLAFRDAVTAKEYIELSNTEGATPRLVMEDGVADIRSLAKDAGATGLLINFNPQTSAYEDATLL